MTALSYPLHFAYLAACIAVLALVPTVSLPLWLDRFAFSFALFGGLHALAFVSALRISGAWRRRIAFVVIAGALSVTAPVLGILLARALSLPESVAWIAVASATGATAYWLMVRRFWITGLSLASAVMTVAACTVASLLSFAVGASLTDFGASTSIAADILPTVAWWLTFSAAIWLSEVMHMTANSSLKRSRDR